MAGSHGLAIGQFSSSKDLDDDYHDRFNMIGSTDGISPAVLVAVPVCTA
jgi:hypothetical protein